MTEYNVLISYHTTGDDTLHALTIKLKAFDINTAVLMGASRAAAMFAGTDQFMQSVFASEAT